MVGPVAYFAAGNVQWCARWWPCAGGGPPPLPGAAKRLLAAEANGLGRPGLRRGNCWKNWAKAASTLPVWIRFPTNPRAAADLPPLELIERVTSIAGQYDLTFEVSDDGKRMTLESAAARRTGAELSGRSASAGNRQKHGIAWRCSAIEVQGDKIVVAGTVEDHSRIRPASPGQSGTARAAESDLASKRFTLSDGDLSGRLLTTCRPNKPGNEG